MMRLHYMHSMNPRKACAIAKHLDSPVEYVLIDVLGGGLTRPDYLAKNPNGLAPVLEVGDRKIWESAAIMVHLAVDAGSDMWPTDNASEQVEVLQWISWDAWQFAPAAGTYYFENLIKPQLFKQPADPAEIEAKSEALHKAARVLDAHLKTRKFLVADRLTVADFCVGVLLPWSEEIELPLSGYSNVQRWHDRLMQLPAWRDPWPAR